MGRCPCLTEDNRTEMSALLLLPSWLPWDSWEPSNITADGNLWSTKYFFLLPLRLYIHLNCDLVVTRCKSWCCCEITLEGRNLTVLPLIWFTGNCRSWKYLRDYPVYLLIFLDEKTVQGLSKMFRVTQCLIRDKNLVLISNPVLFS